MDDFIRLEEVRKIYQTGQVVTKAVDGINFTISEGEFVRYYRSQRRRKDHDSEHSGWITP